MKKIVIASAIIMGLATATFSQTVQVCQPDTVVLLYDHSIFEVGETMQFIMTYDDKGLFSKYEIYYREQPFKCNGSKGEVDLRLPIQVRTIYEYDVSCNLVHSTEQYYAAPRPPRYYHDYYIENNRRLLYVRHYECIEDYYCTDSVLYLYDNSGRISHETKYSRVYGALDLSKEIGYTYNAPVIEKTTNGLSNGYWGEWVTLERKTQTFDDEETLLTVETEYYEKPTTLETHYYDEEGHVTGILTQTGTNGEWVNTKLLEYTYDGNGRLVIAEIKLWQEEEFVHAHRAVYELNEAGYPVAVDFQKWNGEEWVQGTWEAGFHIFSEPYLAGQNELLCRSDAKHIEISYTTTNMPSYDLDEPPTELNFAIISPNPTSGLVTVTGKSLKQAEVFNTLGQRVLSVTGEGDKLHINLQGQHAGIYIVNVTDTEGRKCVMKVVKE